ncbi:TetR/AcrR family transcriptional regulator [uncultured Roseobacter sp.]|uniref:TetR/AcrR family transcriptional regulator n=1 Tax=uncultured Roseobacter sp. TaxID=114847 RepID=UPI0026391081|nr:TetR/AcrR family transcriptional regulator [uncultured Roseobacter sp.]
MPWEKTFDLDEAIDRATEVFGKKGYDATSMSDLTAAMKINKGSLYNAFGSKKELFDRSLARYDQKNRAATLASLRQRSDPVAAIEAFFDGLIEDARNDPRNLGCFVINTAQDLPNQPPEIVRIIQESLEDIELFFREMVKKGQKTGQVPDTTDPVSTAHALLSMLVGLRLLSRGAVGVPVLEGVRDGAMRLVRGDT